MCIAPITIKNKSRRYRDGLDKMFFDVPCGHCFQCRKQEQDEWFVRAFYEWKRVSKVGGHVFFPTFSYRNEDLHWYHDYERDYHLPCFNASDVKSFRDKLRVNFNRAGYPSKEVRYILLSEFGGDNGRPHLHGLIFVPFHISSFKMLQILKKSWSHGWTMISEKGLEIRSVNAVRYAMKYATKDSYWFKKYGIYDYLSELRNDRVNKVPHADEVYKKFCSVLPRHFQSIGFGFDMVYDLLDNEDEFVTGKIDLSRRGLVTGSKFKFHIPRYVYRKLMKVKDQYNTDVPTIYAEKVFKKLFYRNIEESVKSLDFLNSYDKFRSHYSPLFFPEQSYIKIWSDLKNVDSIRDLVIYSMVYKDVPLLEDPFLDRKFLIDDAFYFAHKQNFCYDDPRPEKMSASDIETDLFNRNRRTYGDLTCFSGFDKALQAIYNMNCFLSLSENNAFNIQDEISHNQWLQDKYIKF